MNSGTVTISLGRQIQWVSVDRKHYQLFQIDSNTWLNPDNEGSIREDEIDNKAELEVITNHNNYNSIIIDNEKQNEDGSPAKVLVGTINFDSEGSAIFEGDPTISIHDQLIIRDDISNHQHDE
jgi:hypothetical protein